MQSAANCPKVGGGQTQ
jgi:hypothetical protein